MAYCPYISIMTHMLFVWSLSTVGHTDCSLFIVTHCSL